MGSFMGLMGSSEFNGFFCGVRWGLMVSLMGSSVFYGVFCGVFYGVL